ncbi:MULTISPECIES: hypothetical protein [unclassified Knoellia]|uniref:hypothetical protein n=1 Tax=Knoellia altitudinis TaxID=3404795 RepID=UPI003612F3F7
MPTAHDAVRVIARARISSSSDRLEYLAHFDDRIWELAGGGPRGLRDRISPVALNPQPLPPVDAGRLLLQVMARGIIVIGGRDGDAREAFMADIEDWCGTGWPRRWPQPSPPARDAHLREQAIPETLLGGALAAAELSASYREGEMQDFFAKVADQLTDAALG